MNIKKIFAAITSSALLMVSGAVFNVSAENGKADDIVILYTNDVHCGIEDGIGYDGLMLYKKEMQEKHENVLLVDAGDAIQGAPIGTLSNGAYITRIMNNVGYDAATLGNHEFDYGMDELSKRGQELNCGYVCSNLYDKDGKIIYQPYKIVNAGEHKVAFVGATTPESLKSSTPKYFQNDKGEYIYSFGEDGTVFERIQKAVNSAKADGADYVVLLAHLGESYVPKNWSAEQAVKSLSGIDVVIDGHSHEVTPGIAVKSKDKKNVLITQTGTKFANIGKLTISSDGDITTELVSSVPKPDKDSAISESDYLEPEGRAGRYVDKAANDEINSIKKDMDALISGKIGTSDFELYDKDAETGLRRVRNGETNLGDLCADAYKDMLDTDVAIVNGGGIRAAIKKGDITNNDVMTVFPYNNKVLSAEVTGQQILDMLECASSTYPEENGSFLQVSGIEYTIDETVKSSLRYDDKGRFLAVDGEYRVKNVKINGEAIDTAKKYTLGSHDYFLKNGGDGYIFSDNCKIIKDNGMTDSEMLSAYIRDYLGGSIPEKYINPYGEGRIKLIAPAPTKPLNVKVNKNGKVTWDAAENVSYYRVGKIVNGSTYYSKKVYDTSYTYEKVPASTYKAFVTAVGKDGQTKRSAIITVKDDRPLGFVNEVSVDKNGVITWTASTNAVAYRMGKVVNGKTYYGAKTSDTSYTLKNVPKKDYQVFVVAYDADGRTAWGRKTSVKVS